MKVGMKERQSQERKRESYVTTYVMGLEQRRRVDNYRGRVAAARGELPPSLQNVISAAIDEFIARRESSL